MGDLESEGGSTHIPGRAGGGAETGPPALRKRAARSAHATRIRRAALAFAGVLACVASARGEDLSKRYKATLDFSEEGIQRESTCEAGDVWSLDAFEFERGSRLKLACGKATLVCGVHEGNVVWAALLPDQPGTIASSVAGDGEHFTSIWLRFHPSHVGELFPAKTVTGAGDARASLWARRLYTHKINSGWQADNFPVIPKRDSIVLDCETREGRRRYFTAEAGAVECVKAFEGRTLPALAPIEPALAVEAFDAAWKAFDEEYAKFELRPEVDWAKLRERYRPWAEQARTTFEAGATIGALLAHLRDLHVWVKAGDEFMPGYNRPRAHNGNWRAAEKLVGTLNDTQHDLVWARSEDRIGYLNVHSLSESELTRVFDEALEQLGDTWGLVIDLRYNGGGDELLAGSLAGRIVDKRRVYAKSRYRSGAKHDQLGAALAREFEPRGPWRYGGPVVALWGQRTMSSAESFAMMLAQCPNVTTMGDRTAGSSANPRRLELPAGLVANLPRWNDLDVEGRPIEDVGFPPQVRVEVSRAELSDGRDAVLEAALERLRKTPKSKRKAVHGK